MKIKLIIPLIILIFQSITAFTQTNNNFGTIIFNLKFSSFNETGFGGKIKITNIETKQEFEGKSPNRFNPHIIVSNLPQGEYKIVELIIKTGSGQIRYYDTLKFNTIEINKGKTFYLGSYRTKKTSEIFKLNYEISFDKKVDTLKIENLLQKNNIKHDNIDFTQKLFLTDTTYLNIKL
jgi:hypothetical protein